MQNEHYYRQQLENAIDNFLDEETLTDNPFGWVGENTVKLMADAAFSVLMASKDVQDYLIKEGHLNA